MYFSQLNYPWTSRKYINGWYNKISLAHTEQFNNKIVIVFNSRLKLSCNFGNETKQMPYLPLLWFRYRLLLWGETYLTVEGILCLLFVSIVTFCCFADGIIKAFEIKSQTDSNFFYLVWFTTILLSCYYDSTFLVILTVTNLYAASKGLYRSSYFDKYDLYFE